LPAKKQWLMTCLDRVDQWFGWVQQPDLLESGAPDEVERLVLLSSISAQSWCF